MALIQQMSQSGQKQRTPAVQIAEQNPGKCSEQEEIDPTALITFCCYCCWLPDSFRGWGHGGRPWSPINRATPQGLDQRS